MSATGALLPRAARRRTVRAALPVPPADLGTALTWAAACGATAVLGRLLQDDGISLLWPAAGVVTLWALARGRGRGRWLDLVLLTLVSAGAVLATDGAPAGALALATGQVVQAVVTVAAVGRSPAWRAARGVRALRGADELWVLVGTAVLASLAGPVATQLVLDLMGQPVPWSTVPARAVRNVASVLVIVPVGLALAGWLRARAAAQARPHRLRAGRLVEHAAALALLPVTYVAWFSFQQVPLVFPLLLLTVWAGARLRTWFVLLHDTVAAVAAVAFTVAGAGPFADVGSRALEVMLAQLYVAIVCTIGLALALARDERLRLVRAAARARDVARAQAELLGTVVDTMSEGVSVVAPDGTIVLRNPRATALLGVDRSAAGDVGTGGAHGLLRLDGTPLPDDALPYRRALAQGAVRDLLLRRAARDPRDGVRILAFNSTPLPDPGRGVVTVVRDVTAERRELEHAAQVQASLLPDRTPDVPGYELAARAVAAGMVGGDVYDWGVEAGRLGLVVADVMGKGVGAAILAATTRAAFRSRPHRAALGDAVAAAERTLAPDLERAGAFVTAFVAAVDPTTHELEYVDAGHGLAFLARARDGRVERLAATGPPLGVLPGQPRLARRTCLAPGDVLVAVSDGLLDALGGSVADLAAVEGALRDACGAEEAVDALVALVPAECEVVDDVTVVALRRRPADL